MREKETRQSKLMYTSEAEQWIMEKKNINLFWTGFERMHSKLLVQNMILYNHVVSKSVQLQTVLFRPG